MTGAEELINMQIEITRNISAMKNNCLVEVMRQVLKREPTKEDAPLFTICIQQGNMNTELIMYDGECLGALILSFDNPSEIGGASFNYSFNPEIKTFR